VRGAVGAWLVAGTLLSAGCRTLYPSNSEDAPFPSRQVEVSILDFSTTYLGRPAYLAKFELIDGVGVSLLYPTSRRDRKEVGPGQHHIGSRAPVFVKTQRQLYVRRAPRRPFGVPESVQQVILLVVAADRPLNLDPFLGSPDGAHRILGDAYTDWNRALERLVAYVVGDVEGEVTWAWDYRTVTVPAGWAIGRF